MDIDLNVSNYSVDDLKHFFNLNSNNEFDKEMLHNKMLELQDKMILCENVNNEFKRNFTHFLNDATNILLKSLHAEDAMQERKLDNVEIHPTHPIVHIPKEPFVYAQSSQAFQGTVNPLERRIITKILSIDSAFRSSPGTTTSNNFVFQLQTPLHNVISMKLVALELPRLWYSISSQLSNNVFRITLKQMTSLPDVSVIITLPDGNYTNIELQTMLTNYFNNSTNGLAYLSFMINAVTGKTIICMNAVGLTANASTDFYYELDFAGQYSGFGNYIGFNKSHYKVMKTNTYMDSFFQTPTYTYQGYITGESSCGLVDNYMFVIVNDFNYNHETNTISSQTPDGFIGDNVLGRITLDISPDNLLVNNASDKIFKKREYFGPVRIRQLEIKLINKYNKMIDLLNNNFSLALEFQILYSS